MDPEQRESDWLVRLSGVDLSYGDAAALAGVDLIVRRNEFVSVLGPSGCGKSTLLRLVADLAQPTRGAVERTWQGNGGANSPCQPLGCVFQDATLMPWATVAKNVALPLELQRRERRDVEAAVAETLAMTGLSDFAGAYPRQLSGGMRMRAAAARALATRPQLLLMDEPFAALDEISRSRLNDDLLALRRRRRFAVLFITHSVYEAAYLSDRVVVLTSRPGRVLTEVAVDFPAERTAELRSTLAYGALCRELSAALNAASESLAVPSLLASRRIQTHE